MNDPGLPPKPRSLNLLESLMLEEEESNRQASSRSRGPMTGSSEYYDHEKQAISRECAPGSYSVSVFDIQEALTATNITKGDPNAGFRGKKVSKANNVNKKTSSSIWDPSESFLEKKKKLQRPFSADYSLLKRKSQQTRQRAKSAKEPRNSHVQSSQGHWSRSRDNYLSDSDSSEEEKENNRDESYARQRYDNIGTSQAEDNHMRNDRSDGSDTASSCDSQLEELDKQEKQRKKQKSVKGLSPQKKKKLRTFQSDPEKFYGEKLREKYEELKKLMSSPLTKQRSQLLRRHLQQMEQLNDQYKVASHGLLAPGLLVPRSMLEDVRARHQRPASARDHQAPSGMVPHNVPEDVRARSQRPTSARPLLRRATNSSDYESNHEVVHERVEPLAVAKPETPKEKHVIEVKQTKSHSDTGDHTSATTDPEPSPEELFPSPRPAVASVDHHIKFSDNDYLKKWLKEKDKMHRRKIREERKKKKEEKERLVLEANEKLERRIQSQKVYDSWMKEKNKEANSKYKELYKTYKEMEKSGAFDKGPNLPEAIKVKNLDNKANTSKAQHTEHQTKHHQKEQRPYSSTKSPTENTVPEVPESGNSYPQQTKFIYKRPAAGKISFNMQVKGTNPFSPRQVSAVERGEMDTRHERQRLSYDDWARNKKSDDDRNKKLRKARESEAQSEAALQASSSNIGHIDNSSPPKRRQVKQLHQMRDLEQDTAKNARINRDRREESYSKSKGQGNISRKESDSVFREQNLLATEASWIPAVKESAVSPRPVENFLRECDEENDMPHYEDSDEPHVNAALVRDGVANVHKRTELLAEVPEEVWSELEISEDLDFSSLEDETPGYCDNDTEETKLEISTDIAEHTITTQVDFKENVIEDTTDDVTHVESQTQLVEEVIEERTTDEDEESEGRQDQENDEPELPLTDDMKYQEDQDSESDDAGNDSTKVVGDLRQNVDSSPSGELDVLENLGGLPFEKKVSLLIAQDQMGPDGMRKLIEKEVADLSAKERGEPAS